MMEREALAGTGRSFWAGGERGASPLPSSRVLHAQAREAFLIMTDDPWSVLVCSALCSAHPLVTSVEEQK
jgi:hypothetical protein